jgi:hypothetical protein
VTDIERKPVFALIDRRPEADEASAFARCGKLGYEPAPLVLAFGEVKSKAVFRLPNT